MALQAVVDGVDDDDDDDDEVEQMLSGGQRWFDDAQGAGARGGAAQARATAGEGDGESVAEIAVRLPAKMPSRASQSFANSGRFVLAAQHRATQRLNGPTWPVEPC